MSSRVVFSAQRHTYSLDGKRVPGVTTVINKATAKPALVNWAAKLTAQWAATNTEALGLLGEDEWIKAATGAANRARDEAMKRGTQLHEAAERLVYGHPVGEDPSGQPYPADVLDMAGQLARFMDSWRVEPVVNEAVVFSDPHRWAGRLDLVADLADGQRWLLDYKTGNTGIWPETSLQLSAYKHATHVRVGDDDREMPEIHAAGAVWIRPDSWELIPVRADVQTYGYFLSAMAVAEWVDRRRDESVYPPQPVPEAVAE